MDTSNQNMNLESEFFNLLSQDKSIVEFIHAEPLVGLWYLNLDDDEAWVSPMLFKTLGYDLSQEKADWNNWKDTVFDEDLETFKINFRACNKNSDRLIEKNIRFRCRDTSTVVLKCRGLLVRDEQGKNKRVLGTHHQLNESDYGSGFEILEECFYSSVLNQLPDVVYAFNVVTGGMFYSKSVEKVIGHSSAYLHENPYHWNRAIHPDFKDLVEDAILGIQSGKPFSIEYQIKNASGDWRWLWDRSLVVKNENEQKVILGIATDITTKKQNEILLENTQIERDNALSLLTKVGELALIGGWEFNLDNEVLHWSDEVFKIHEVAIGDQPDLKRAIGYFKGTHQDSVKNCVKECIEQSKPFDLEAEIITQTGTEKDVRLFGDVKRDLHGHAIALWGSIQDISLKKEMETVAAENLKFREAFVNMSPDIIYLYDLVEQRNVYINKSIERILGYSPSEVLEMGGNLLTVLMHPDDFTNYWEAVVPLYKKLNSGNELRHHYRMKHKSGEWRYLESIETPYKTVNFDVIQILGVARDITVQKQYEEELRNARILAEESNRAKGQFLANMSHEIRTPMNGFMGMLQLLEMTDLNLEQQEYLRTSQSSANALLKVINDILNYSKIDAGHTILENHPFDLKMLLEEMISLFNAPACTKGLSLTFIMNPDVPEKLMGDEFKLKQILSNLIGNAIKFTDKGYVEIHVNRTNTVDIGIVELEFSVRDTGIGIQEDKRSILFNRFTQADESHTRAFGGTGLGLAISKGLVELMGGEIWIEDNGNKGSVFQFSCRLKEDVGCDTRIPSVTTKGKLDSCDFPVRILLAEDDPISSHLIVRIAMKQGWEIYVAENGERAVELFRSKTFDVILMDVQMPVMDGYQATRIIREIEGDTRHARIIALTAHTLHGDELKCLEAGMDEFIAKPIEISSFIKTIVSYMSPKLKPVRN